MVTTFRKQSRAARSIMAALLLLLSSVTVVMAQPGRTERADAKQITVTKVDGTAMWAAIKPSGKPVLVNFWATWCDPCREEFPDLVKIAEDYRGKVDVVTVSLDDPAEIDGDVRRFLTEMKADMPAYLLSTPDEDAVISSVSKQWGGALPFTIIFDPAGKMTYQKLGKFKTDVLRAAIDRTLAPPAN